MNVLSYLFFYFICVFGCAGSYEQLQHVESSVITVARGIF